MAPKPNFIITIDTGGDNIWSKPKKITTHNVNFLPQFQSLFESYGLKPIYLTNYEMAISPVFKKFGKDILTRETEEIGIHLHAWNIPSFQKCHKPSLDFPGDSSNRQFC